MNYRTNRIVSFAVLGLLAGLATAWPGLLSAQPGWPYPPATTPDAQRNALNNVRSQAGWLQSATQSAPSYRQGGYNLVWQQFQAFRGAYVACKSTLTPKQLNYGANDLADLDAGLDIIQEAFNNYQADLASGRSESWALRNLCQVLRQAAGVWLKEFNKHTSRLHVGWS